MLDVMFKQAGDPKSDLTFIFCNGFGSDYTYWIHLVPKFLNYNCIMLSENYFDQPTVRVPDLKPLLEGKYLVGVGHSLGYEKLCLLQSEYNFIKLKKIVSIEGFSRYLGHEYLYQCLRKPPLEFMKMCYAANPLSTLLWFQMFCGQFPPLVPPSVNYKLFYDDLNLLDDGIPSPEIPHLVLSSIDDPVIPFYIIEDNFRKLNDVEIIYTKGTGHLLGMQQSTWVYRKIMDFVLKD